MRKLRELTTRYSLAELVEALATTVGDGETEPEAKPEGEKEFVKLHKTARHKDPYGNKGSEAVKEAPYKKQSKDAGFPKEVKEETEIDEAAGIARGMAKSANPLIKRPKYDARGNVILTKDAKKNIEYGKKPRSRKLSGRPYTAKKSFGENKEQLDERGIADVWNDDRRLKDRAKKEPSIDQVATSPAGWRSPEGLGKKEKTVLVSPKGEKGGGKVRRIPKSQYDPKKHSLAEEQLDELSQETLKTYGMKAVRDRAALKAYKGSKYEQSSDKRAIKNRGEGIQRASQRLSGEMKVGHKFPHYKKYHAEETEQLDELKKDTLASYTKGAAKSLEDLSFGRGHAMGRSGAGANWNVNTRKIGNRKSGIGRSQDRLTGTYEVGKPMKVMIPGKDDNDKASGPYTIKKKKLYHGDEYEPEGKQLDEVSKKTLTNYIKVGSASAIAKAYSGSKEKDPEKAKKLTGKAVSRVAGITQAADRLSGKFKHKKSKKESTPYSNMKYSKYHGEETEQLDEAGLSKARLSSYIGPAKKSAESLMKVYQQKTKEVGPRNYSPEGLKSLHKAQRREKGIDQAQARIRGERRVPDSEINKRVEDEWAHPVKNFFKSASKRVHNRYYKPYNVQEEAEQLDELKPATLRSYIQQAVPSDALAREDTQLDETITKDTPVGDVIHDFVHSKNKVFSGDDKKQRIKRALGAYYGKQRGK